MTITNPVLRFCGDFVVRHGWKLGPRVLDEHELVYFPQGSDTVYQITDRIYVLNQPCWVITRAGDEHSYRFGENAATRHLFVHFSGGESFAPCLLGFQGSDTIPSQESEFPASIISHLLQIAHRSRDLDRCNILLATLLSELEHTNNTITAKPDTQIANSLSKNVFYPFSDTSYSTVSVYPRVVTEALSYIHNRLVGPITVAEIAAYCQMSHEHLTRTFVRAIGLPPRQVIIRLRLERAAHMLRHNTLSIKEIAVQCGFSENHYFSRMFSAGYGLTATAYRAKFADKRVQHITPDGSFEAKYPINTSIHFKP